MAVIRTRSDGEALVVDTTLTRRPHELLDRVPGIVHQRLVRGIPQRHRTGMEDSRVRAPPDRLLPGIRNQPLGLHDVQRPTRITGNDTVKSGRGIDRKVLLDQRTPLGQHPHRPSGHLGIGERGRPTGQGLGVGGLGGKELGIGGLSGKELGIGERKDDLPAKDSASEDSAVEPVSSDSSLAASAAARRIPDSGVFSASSLVAAASPSSRRSSPRRALPWLWSVRPERVSADPAGAAAVPAVRLPVSVSTTIRSRGSSVVAVGDQGHLTGAQRLHPERGGRRTRGIEELRSGARLHHVQPHLPAPVGQRLVPGDQTAVSRVVQPDAAVPVQDTEVRLAVRPQLVRGRADPEPARGVARPDELVACGPASLIGRGKETAILMRRSSAGPTSGTVSR